MPVIDDMEKIENLAIQIATDIKEASKSEVHTYEIPLSPSNSPERPMMLTWVFKSSKSLDELSEELLRKLAKQLPKELSNRILSKLAKTPIRMAEKIDSDYPAGLYYVLPPTSKQEQDKPVLRVPAGGKIIGFRDPQEKKSGVFNHIVPIGKHKVDGEERELAIRIPVGERKEEVFKLLDRGMVPDSSPKNQAAEVARLYRDANEAYVIGESFGRTRDGYQIMEWMPNCKTWFKYLIEEARVAEKVPAGRYWYEMYVTPQLDHAFDRFYINCSKLSRDEVERAGIEIPDGYPENTKHFALDQLADLKQEFTKLKQSEIGLIFDMFEFPEDLFEKFEQSFPRSHARELVMVDCDRHSFNVLIQEGQDNDDDKIVFVDFDQYKLADLVWAVVKNTNIARIPYPLLLPKIKERFTRLSEHPDMDQACIEGWEQDVEAVHHFQALSQVIADIAYNANQIKKGEEWVCNTNWIRLINGLRTDVFGLPPYEYDFTGLNQVDQIFLDFEEHCAEQAKKPKGLSPPSEHDRHTDWNNGRSHDQNRLRS